MRRKPSVSLRYTPAERRPWWIMLDNRVELCGYAAEIDAVQGLAIVRQVRDYVWAKATKEPTP